MVGLPSMTGNGEIVEAAPVAGEDGFSAGQRLPTANRRIDVVRVQLDSRRSPSGALGRKDGRAGTGEWVEHEAAPLGTVADRISDQRNRLDGRVQSQVLVTSRSKRVGTSVVPDVRPVAPVSAKL